MEGAINRFVRDESGQALVIVLCLLIFGGLTIVPLLNHVYSGVSSSHINRERIELLYAADAGMEDGIWKSENGEVTLDPYDYVTEYTYSLPEEMNGKQVNVSIKQIWPLEGLESDVNGTTPASPPLMITGGVVNTQGDFDIRISYDTPEEELLIDRVAVLLPPDFEYVADSSSGITTDNPTQVDWNGGKALMWDFSPAVNFDDLPQPGQGDPMEGGMQPAVELPVIKVLSFKVTPLDELARGCYCWVRTTDNSLYLCWDTNMTIYQVNSTATDTLSGRSTTTKGITYVCKGFEEGWLDLGVSLFNGDYRAVGNTNMRDANQDRRRETVISESSATINNIPGDADVALAFLYWSGWKNYTGSMEPDKVVTFRIEAESDSFRPNDSGTYTECEPVGDDPNYRCVDEVISDGDSTYVRTGDEPFLLRPDGTGSYTQCDAHNDFPNYQCVDEAVADEDYTYVQTRYGATEIDTYDLDFQGGSGQINSVTVHIRSRAESDWDDMAVRTVIRTHDTNYFGNYTLLGGGWWEGDWTDVSTTYTTNPYTGSAWNWGEIGALEAGVRQYDLGDGYVRTTQVYVEVDKGIPGGEVEIDTYNLEDIGVPDKEIISVTVHAISKSTISEDTNAVETVLRTYDTDYFGSYTLLPTSYTDIATTYTTNPFTGVAWTWSEIDDLEAGVKQYEQGSGTCHTTQVYIEVLYAVLLEQEITADKWWLLENQAPDYAYSCFKDVTGLVQSAVPTGNAIYFVGGVYGDTGTELSYAGWSLIIIYSSPSEEGHLFYLYDSLTFAGTNAYGTFTIEGFVAPADAEATLTCFVGEGDDWYNNDSLRFNDNYLSDATNPQDDVWNGKSSGLGGEQIDGIDIDTFDVSSPMINPGDTSATLSYNTAQDNWNLIYHILSFRSDQAVLTPSSTGCFSWGTGGQ